MASPDRSKRKILKAKKNNACKLPEANRDLEKVKECC